MARDAVGLLSGLGTIKAPTLVVHGSDDPLVPPACGRDMATPIPDAQLQLIDGMGHDLPRHSMRPSQRLSSETLSEHRAHPQDRLATDSSW